MHRRTEEVLAHLARTRAALGNAVSGVLPEHRGTRPSPDAWSVNEIIEHVSLVEARVATMLAEAIDRARAEGIPAETETSPVVDDAFVRDFTDRSQVRLASEASQPKGASLDDSWLVLREKRARLRDAIVDADGLALGGIRLPHPRLGEIDMYQWLAFLGAHEERHVAQIDEVAAAFRA